MLKQTVKQRILIFPSPNADPEMKLKELFADGPIMLIVQAPDGSLTNEKCSQLESTSVFHCESRS
jgi:hypothetical protein